MTFDTGSVELLLEADVAVGDDADQLVAVGGHRQPEMLLARVRARPRGSSRPGAR